LIHQHRGAHLISLTLIAYNVHQISTRKAKLIVFAELKQFLQVNTGHEVAPPSIEIMLQTNLQLLANWLPDQEGGCPQSRQTHGIGRICLR
jgi:hypothetical protein